MIVRDSPARRRWEALMATLHKEIFIELAHELVWDAIRDIGALHTRLVPGFVVDTKLEPGARVVHFGNGMVVKEPILSLDEERRRLAWTAEGGSLRHYNAVMEVRREGDGARVLWTSDLLPDAAAETLGRMQDEGLATMKRTLERLR
jgi:hypothetical protein